MKNIELKERWKLFGKIIFDPWIIFLIAFIIILFIYSGAQSNDSIKSFINVMISIISGLLGSIISKRWTDYNDEKVIVVRGITAIRSLKLLLLNISAVEKRVKVYITKLNKEDMNYELIKTNFEEVIEKCNIIEEEGLSSIENWADIIPEANIKTQIGILSEMKLEKDNLEGQLIVLKNNLEENKQIDQREKDELKKLILNKEEQLTKTKKELNEKERKINNSILSGLTPPTGSLYVDFRQNYPNLNNILDVANEFTTGYRNYYIDKKKKCVDCGCEFEVNAFESLTQNKCKKCRDKEGMNNQ